MNALLFLAADNPLDHVVDHDLGLPLGITKHVLFMLMASAGCIVMMTYVARQMANGEPGGRLAGVIEAILLFIRNEVVRPFMGKEGDKFLPIIWTIFFFVLFCNLIGLVPGSATATGNINVTAALALFAFFMYHFYGLRKNGLVHYLKANLLVGPAYLWWLMIPIEIMGHFIKPAALAIRLFANMVAGHTMLAVFMGFCLMLTAENILGGGLVAGVSVTAAVAIYFLEIFVAFLQAFVFAFLTTVFLSMALHPEH